MLIDTDYIFRFFSNMYFFQISNYEKTIFVPKENEHIFAVLFINVIHKSCHMILCFASKSTSLVNIYGFMHHIYSKDKDLSKSLVDLISTILKSITLKNAS